MKTRKVLVTKSLRDDIIKLSNDNLELDMQKRKVIVGVIEVINKRIKDYRLKMKIANKKYRLDKKASKKVMKAKIKEAKEIFKEEKIKAIDAYKSEIYEFYKPVAAEKENISRAKKEKKEQVRTLDEIREEILSLQKYKTFIDAKYTSDKKELIDEALIPKELRLK